MAETYFKIKVYEIVGGYIFLGVILTIIIFVAGIVWMYKKMCNSRKKRMDRLAKKYFDNE